MSPQPHQKLWYVRYGTMTQLVWAGTAEYAELKVRLGMLDWRFTPYELDPAKVRGERGDRPYLRGEMAVRVATQDDLVEWDQAGGKPMEWSA